MNKKDSMVNLFVGSLVFVIIYISFGVMPDFATRKAKTDAESETETSFWHIKHDPSKKVEKKNLLFSVPPPPFKRKDVFPCSDCHDDPKAVKTNRRELKEDHTDIKLQHDAENRWCLDCHDATNRDKLHLANGTLVDFKQSYILCGQCHGDKLRDWKLGIHGKRTGYWSDEARLFIVQIDEQGSLGQQKISELLRKKFEEHKILLSQNATVKIIKSDKEWEITDGAGKWVIKNESQMLNIYGEGKKSYLLCVHCHDPHSPRFKPIHPKPVPVQYSQIKLK